MRQMTAMVWKEWKEARAFLWIALGIFVGMPVIAGLEVMGQFHKPFEIDALPWVDYLGGMLAIFVGVGVTCRDFNGRLEDFWRSRPVSATRWLLVKYFVGLGVVLVGCMVPPAVELAFSKSREGLFYIIEIPFFWAVIFGIGFLAGCLVRRPGHAAMLGLTGMLLMYFLPVVIPPLHWMNVIEASGYFWQFDYWRSLEQEQITFAVGMLGLAIVFLAVAVLAVRRDWRVKFGQKMMYCSVSGAALILFASAAFQLGTNMPILKQIDLPKGEDAWQIHCNGSEGYVLTVCVDSHQTVQNNYRTIRVRESGIELGRPVPLTMPIFSHEFYAHAPGNPAIVYSIDSVEDASTISVWLKMDQMDHGNDQRILHLEDFKHYSGGGSRWCLYISGEKLYVMGDRLITMDISKPLSPRVISNVPFEYQYRVAGHWSEGDETLRIILPAVPGLTARERLEAVIEPYEILEGDMLCIGYTEPNGVEYANDLFFAYRLKRLTEDGAVFEKVGERSPTMLENIFGSGMVSGMNLQNGLLYVDHSYGRFIVGNPRVDVFDADGERPLRLVGHFAAPNVLCVCPLPDGNALVGGNKIWLVGPPGASREGTPSE